MDTIQTLLKFYQEKADATQVPFEEQSTLLHLQLESLSEMAFDQNPVTAILAGVDALEVVGWASKADAIAMAQELIERAIELLGQKAERARKPLEKRTAHILTSYKACLSLKDSLLRMGADAPPMYKNQFQAEKAALAAHLADAPIDLVATLFEELNRINLPDSMAKLVA